MAQERNCINDFALLVFKYYIKHTLSQGTKRECKLQTQHSYFTSSFPFLLLLSKSKGSSYRDKFMHCLPKRQQDDNKPCSTSATGSCFVILISINQLTCIVLNKKVTNISLENATYTCQQYKWHINQELIIDNNALFFLKVTINY